MDENVMQSYMRELLRLYPRNGFKYIDCFLDSEELCKEDLEELNRFFSFQENYFDWDVINSTQISLNDAIFIVEKKIHNHDIVYDIRPYKYFGKMRIIDFYLKFTRKKSDKFFESEEKAQEFIIKELS